MNKNEIVIFDNQNIKLEVNMKDDNVWLNLDQLAQLFNRDKSVISRHIKNVLEEELKNEEVVAKFATTTKHGAIAGKTQTHQVDYYNLDVIISVGYRVKSKNGIIFRKWANQILKDYLIKGYAENEKRLASLEKTVKLIEIANRSNDLSGSDAKKILEVIGEYSNALDLLDDYDHRKLKKVKGVNDTREISYEECKSIIEELRFNEESDLFALERDRGLEAIIAAIYQTFDGIPVYKSVEEKAANLLYMITKNHVFIDGNKRIAATLFICFLNYYDILYKDDIQIIDNNTLAAVTILIAESNPKEKSTLIDLIMNFLNPTKK